MKAGLIAICLTFVFGATDLRANEVLGSGAQSCGTWLAQQNEAIHQGRRLWVLGYLSGVNSMSSIDFLKGYEVNGIAAAIDNYCRQNPLKGIDDAANDVALQMYIAKTKK